MVELYLVRQIPENRVVSGLILSKVLLNGIILDWVVWLYLVKQIPENTDRVVSDLVLTKVLLNGIVCDWVVSCKTDS